MKSLHATPTTMNAGWERIDPTAAAKWVVEHERLVDALRAAEQAVATAQPAEDAALRQWGQAVADELSTTTLDRQGELARIVAGVRRAGGYVAGFAHEMRSFHRQAVSLFSNGDPDAFRSAFGKLTPAPDSVKLAELRAERDGLQTELNEHRAAARSLFPAGPVSVVTPSGIVRLVDDVERDATACVSSLLHWAACWRRDSRLYGQPVSWRGELIESFTGERRKAMEGAYKLLGCKPAASIREVQRHPLDASTGRPTAFDDRRNFPAVSRL